MNTTSKEIKRQLRELGDSRIAEHSQRFFKTGKGEYGEGDKFLGIRVPEIRKQVKKYKGISLEKIQPLLTSEYHEIRLFALLALVQKFRKGDDECKEKIYNFYADHLDYINNWDLVDSSAPYIMGEYLLDRDKRSLYDLAVSDDLWRRRVAIISTYYFIKAHRFKDTLNIAEILHNDTEDLIHKAVGWMLREIGNRDMEVEDAYLKNHYKTMPRTMLRYSIEKFPESRRKAYLRGEI